MHWWVGDPSWGTWLIMFLIMAGSWITVVFVIWALFGGVGWRSSGPSRQRSHLRPNGSAGGPVRHGDKQERPQPTLRSPR